MSRIPGRRQTSNPSLTLVHAYLRGTGTWRRSHILFAPPQRKRAAPCRGFHTTHSPNTLREVHHLTPGGFRFVDGWTALLVPITLGRPFRSATMSDSRNSSLRSRPIRSFRVTSTTTPRAGMRSTHADMRCRRSVSPLRRRPRSAAHDGAILARARCEPRPLPICLRLPLFTDRPFDRTWRSALASTSECPPRGCA